MSNLATRVAQRYLRGSELPDVVYHATPHPKSILSGGFQLQEEQTFGGHTGKYISATTLENASAYASALRLSIAFLSGQFGWQRFREELQKTYGISDKDWRRALQQNSTINQLRQVSGWKNKLYRGKGVEGQPIGRGEELDRRWGIVKHLWLIIDDFPLFTGVGQQKRLAGLDASQVGVVEARTGEAAIGDRYDDAAVTYHSPENEWRFWDPSLLTPVDIIWNF